MASLAFEINGIKYIRMRRQGRTPSGLGIPRKYRLYSSDEERLRKLKSDFGYYYNENEIVRMAVKSYLDIYFSDSVPLELLIP